MARHPQSPAPIAAIANCTCQNGRVKDSLQVFSTAGLPAARRIELWEGHNATALIGLSCHSAIPLEATEVNVPLGQVQLARVTGSPHVVERNAAFIRRDPAGAVAVYVTLRGQAWFRDEDGTTELRPGQLLVCDADRPFARGFARGLEELAIKVPADKLAAPLRSALNSGPVVTATSAAYFSHAFRARFGLRAGEVRRAAAR